MDLKYVQHNFIPNIFPSISFLRIQELRKQKSTTSFFSWSNSLWKQIHSNHEDKRELLTFQNNF